MLKWSSFWYVNFTSEMKVFGLVGGVRVYMVVFEAHKYGQYYRNSQQTTHHAITPVGYRGNGVRMGPDKGGTPLAVRR